MSHDKALAMAVYASFVAMLAAFVGGVNFDSVRDKWERRLRMFLIGVAAALIATVIPYFVWQANG